MYQIKEINCTHNELTKDEARSLQVVETLLHSKLPFKDRVIAFEDYLVSMPQSINEPTHEFIDGLCKRTTIFDANTLVTGAIHVKPHMDVMLEGEMLIATEDGFKHLVAPCTMTTAVGTKKAAIALKRTVWVSYHATNAKNREELEKEFTLNCTLREYQNMVGG